MKVASIPATVECFRSRVWESEVARHDTPLPARNPRPAVAMIYSKSNHFPGGTAGGSVQRDHPWRFARGGGADTDRRSMPLARNTARIQNRRMRDAPGSTGLFAKPLMAVDTAFTY